MRVALFCHSLRSDWNHGNAHFLRGVATELAARGHEVRAFEPEDGWSARHLAADHGASALVAFSRVYPRVRVTTYRQGAFDLAEALDGVGLCLVHEWTDPALARRLGAYRRASLGLRLLFHDTHHRVITDPWAMADYDLWAYDGVLAFGEALRALYIERGLSHRVFSWHEAADTRVFYPLPRLGEGGAAPTSRAGRDGAVDLAWIGNWGDEERTRELFEFLIEPSRALGLRGVAHGVRYPRAALAALAGAGLAYGGYLPNFEVPALYRRARVTVHIPRRAYTKALPGIPTIRPFEAMASGIPLVCAPWEDAEGLFRPGRDYLVARTSAEMRAHLRAILSDRAMAEELVKSALETIRTRHTCAHRVDQLLGIAAELGASGAARAASPGERRLAP